MTRNTSKHYDDINHPQSTMDDDKFNNEMLLYGDQTPGVEIEDGPKSSNFQAFMNTAKLFFGNAYLSIPNTFMFAGLIGGILMFSLVGALNCYTMIQLLKVAEKHPKIGSYSQLSLKVFGKRGKIVVDVSIWIMQLSCCISYLFFIGK